MVMNVNDDYDRKCRIVLEGISKEALEVLKELGHVGSPVFQFYDPETLEALPQDAATLALRAAVRDGESRVVQAVLSMRSRGKRLSQQHNT